MALQSTFLQESESRGFLHQATHLEELDQHLTSKKPVAAYLGFDMTAKSLHVGSLTCIMWLRRLQKSGHKPIVLLGGGTTKIGDPTGKDQSRKMLSEQDIQENMNSIKTVFEKFLKFGDGPTDAVIVNNADWLDTLKYVEVLRDIGPHFTVNRMLSFESVKRRLEREQPLSFLEFNYMICQSYDFLKLYESQNCVLQLGGSDQWGNIVSGVELVRRIKGKSAYGLTCPLITTASGEKMGKTADGAVWLNGDMLSPYDYWQFWRNTDDRDVIKYMQLFTDMPLSEIEQFEGVEGAALNDVKKRLADEATALLHGKDCLDDIHSRIATLFEQKGGNDWSTLPKVVIDNTDITFDALFVETGLCQTKGEAKRLITGKGGRLNDQIIPDPRASLSDVDFNDQGELKLSAGKKKHIIVSRRT